jgi:hypothetical protein
MIGEFGMDSATPAKRKESYSTPKLTIYGTIEKLTKAVGPKRSADGGSFPKNRTGL